MSSYASARARPYDLFKTIVALMLLAIIVILLLRFGSVSPQALPVIGAANVGQGGQISASGRGQPGAPLEMWANETRLGVVTVGADGLWTYAGQVQPGDYQLTARTVDASGKVLNQSAPSRITVAPLAPTPAPAPSAEPTRVPSLALAPTATPQTAIALANTAAPTAPPTAVPTTAPVPTLAPTVAPPAATPAPTVSPPSVAPANVAASLAPATTPSSLAPARLNPPAAGPEGRISMSGTGQPGSTVEIWADGKKLASVTVGADGKWSQTGELQPGEHRLTARAVSANGDILNESEPQVVNLAPVAPTAPAVTATPAAARAADQAYVVQAGDWMTKIAVSFYGDMSFYKLIVDGTNAKAAQDSSFTRITDPDAIEVGQKLWIPAR